MGRKIIATMHRSPAGTAWRRLCIVFFLISVSQPAFAAEVQISVSQRETEVGIPITLSIEITNATNYERPTFPDIPNATIHSLPGEQSSSMTTIINGQVTSKNTRTISYRIVPTQTGTISIPAFDVIADGQTFTSQPIEIIVSKSDAASEGLLFVEIQSDKQTLYLGESLNATLRIWIRPYQDKQFNIRLSSNDMVGRIDFSNSDFGDFTETLTSRRDPFGGLQINAVEELHSDHEGNLRSYYLMELPAKIWPQQAGPLALNSPRIVVEYPVKLSRQTGIFGGGQLAISQSRTISATATLPPVQVLEPPAEGRPDTFVGAVGRFDIAVTAKPVDVTVGDPITLTITVIDQTGNARMDVVSPPPLDRMEELTDQFRMPGDALAGVVQGNRKTFTQTLRAKNAQVTHIPAIPFTFFDPIEQKYITRSSEPIAITVKPGSKMDPTEIVQADGLSRDSTPVSPGLKTVSGGLLANEIGFEAMLSSQDFHVSSKWIAATVFPPAFFLLIWVGQLALSHRTKNEAAIRLRNAGKNARAQLKHAQRAEPREQATGILAAMNQYVSDRLALNGQTLTGGEMTSLLRQREVDESLMLQLAQLIDDCNRCVYSGSVDGTDPNNLAERAMACVDKLERSRLK